MSILNETVANLINIRYQAKNAHWNCSGPLFYELHLLFDRIYDDYEDLIDRLAERLRGLGGRVSGTVTQVNQLSVLVDQPLIDSALELAQSLLLRLEELKTINLINIDLANAENDQTSLNVLCEVQETIDKHIYLLRSSLR